MARGCWQAFQDRTRASLQKRFRALGSHVARRPGCTLLLSVAISHLVGCGLILVQWESDLIDTYIPRAVDSVEHQKDLTATFGTSMPKYAFLHRMWHRRC